MFLSIELLFFLLSADFLFDGLTAVVCRTFFSVILSLDVVIEADVAAIEEPFSLEELVSGPEDFIKTVGT